MNTLTKMVIIFAMTAILPACSGSAEKPFLTVEESLVIKGYTVVGPVNSISDHRINGWSYVNDKFIIINAGVRDDYLIGLRHNCHEARSAMNLGFTNVTGRLTTADKLIVKAPGGFTEHCYIKSITRLERVRKKDSDN